MHHTIIGIFQKYGEFHLYNTQTWMLFVSRFLIVISFSVSMFFFSIYLHTELTVSLKVIGSIMMISALIGAGAMMIGGALSDKFGRKPMMCISTFLRTLVFLGMAYCIKTQPNVLILAGLYICSRVLGSLFLPSADAMLADHIKPEHRSKAFSLMRIFANGGFALGPAIGGLIAEISYVSLFITSAVMSMLVFLFIFFFIQESAKRSEKESISFIKNLSVLKRDPTLVTFCLVSFSFFVVMGQFGVTFAIYTVDTVGITKAQFGQLFLCNGLLVMAFQYPISLFIDPIPNMKKLKWGMAIYTLGFFSLGFAHSFLFLIVSVIVITFGEMIFEPSANSIVSIMAPNNAKGSYMGAFGLTRLLGWSLAPLIGGYLLHCFVDQGIILWSIIGFIGFIGVLGYVVLEKTNFKLKDL